MTRRRLLLLFLPALLMGLLAAASAWILRSESGAAWVWQRVVGAVPGELEIEQLTGSLQSGLRLTGLGYQQDGFSLQAERVALRLDLDLLPPAVTIESLRTFGLEMRSEDTPEPEDSVDWSWISELELSLPISFRDARADRLTWAEGDAPPALDLKNVSLSLDWYRRMELQQVRFATAASEWQGSGMIELQSPHRLELSLEAATEIAALAADGTRLALLARASGSLASSRLALTVPERGLSLTGELVDLLQEPGWDLQVEAERLAWPPDAPEPDWAMEELFLSSYGNAADYDVEAAGLVSGSGLSSVAVRLVGAGEGDEIRFEQVDAEGESLAALGTGRLAWSPRLYFEADLDVERFDPSAWVVGWGEAAPAAGRLRLRWEDDEMAFDIPSAQAAATLGNFHATGSINTQTGSLAADLAWQGLSWPPGSDSPQLASEQGRIRLGGTVDGWTVAGALSLNGPDFPAGRLRVEGGGNRDSMAFEVPEGQVLGGRLAGRFEVDWAGATAWSAETRLSDVATGPLLPGFPGQVSGRLSARGRSADGGGQSESLEVEIHALEGFVRGRTVHSEGGLALVDGRLNARDLRLRSGQTTITADGHMASEQGLSVRLVSAGLGDLVDGAAGRFEGSGNLSLAGGRPRLTLQGSGRELVWGELSIAELELDGSAGEGGTVRLEARELQIGNTLVNRLEASAGGASPLEQVDVLMTFEQAETRLRMQGGVQNWGAPLESGWQGRVETLQTDHPQLGFIALEGVALLELKPSDATLGQACFRGSREGRLCLQGGWRNSGDAELEATLEQVSPNLAMRLLNSELSFSQRLNGVLEWRRHPQASPQARVHLEVTPGRISEPGEEEPILTTGPGLFSFEIADGALHSGNLDVPLEGSGRIDTDFSVPDLAAGAEATVQGQLRIDLDSIEPLLRLVPAVEGRSGPVTADLKLGGSLADPKMTGHLSLVRGRISHFATGLVLEDVQLAGAVYEYDQTELSGSFRAGEGRGTLRTVLNFNDPLHPEILLQVQGSKLTLVDVPDLRVIVDPDLRLSWRQGALNIDGRVEIPSARLSPRYLPTAAAVESEDVVIVAGADSLPVVPDETQRNYRIQGQLELALGRDVQLILDRATARLTGKADFRWGGQLVPVADGSFVVSGEIKAYGQLLTVTDGRINFSGRPADNPFLNIRAERDIYGNTQVTQAGVRVSGTLKQPDVEVYTVPMTTRERALSMLVTGSDFNYEQGVGSVEVGMYVAPKLYISYGIGLFDDQNVISARYDLGKGFGIKTTSGQRETGADISYTIER